MQISVAAKGRDVKHAAPQRAMRPEQFCLCVLPGRDRRISEV